MKVDDPHAGLSVIMKDKDYIGEDDFLGQILISSLHDLQNGKWLRKHIDCLVKMWNLIVLIVVRLNYNVDGLIVTIISSSINKCQQRDYGNKQPVFFIKMFNC